MAEGQNDFSDDWGPEEMAERGPAQDNKMPKQINTSKICPIINNNSFYLHPNL